MACKIMVVKIGDRREHSPKVQEVLSCFGCSIKVRLGLHETENVCSEEGILILQLAGEKEELLGLEKALNELPSVTAKMVFID